MVKRIHGMDYRWHLGRLEVHHQLYGWQTSTYNTTLVDFHLGTPQKLNEFEEERVTALYETFKQEIK